MVLWWKLLVTFFPIGFAQENCSKTRVDFPAPVFGAGDNLSAGRCGFWNTQNIKQAPWRVLIRYPTGGSCYSTLISKTSVLVYGCLSTAEEFESSLNKGDWEARLGKCALNKENDCVENGQGQVLKIKNVTTVNAPGLILPLFIWKIDKATFLENYIAPLCIFNKGNQHDFIRTQQYEAFYNDWDNNTKLLAELSEDFGPCLNESKQFQTCHRNFLCAHLSKDNTWIYYLTHQDEKNRHFLRALVVEGTFSRHKFYHELFPLLDQIISLSGDIPLMPTIPQAKKKIDFGTGQSFPGCGTLSSNRRKRDDSEEEDTIVGFLHGGGDTKPKMQPWHAALNSAGDSCGATLVSTKALVTAAHCLVDKYGIPRNAYSIEITVGLINRNDIVDPKQKKRAERVFVHEKFNPTSYDNDVAVVLVAAPGFEFSATVKPICLWNHDYELKHIENTPGKVVGWGILEDNTVPDILQTANLPVLPYKECYLKRNKFFSKYLKPGHNFCAGGNGVTACGGDSGGGFTMERDGKWFLRGVVSFGRASKLVVDGQNVTVCNATLPSVYADVTHYMDWIAQKANLHKISDEIKDYILYLLSLRGCTF